MQERYFKSHEDVIGFVENKDCCVKRYIDKEAPQTVRPPLLWELYISQKNQASKLMRNSYKNTFFKVFDSATSTTTTTTTTTTKI